MNSRLVTQRAALELPKASPELGLLQTSPYLPLMHIAVDRHRKRRPLTFSSHTDHTGSLQLLQLRADGLTTQAGFACPLSQRRPPLTAAARSFPTVGVSIGLP